MNSQFDLSKYAAIVTAPERLTNIESWHRHIPFAFALLDMAKPNVYVELGTHRGDSYSAFCQGVLHQELPTRCYAVDTWKGDEHAGEYSNEVYEDLIAWHDPRYSSFSSLLRMTFDEALAHFPDGSVDVLHIDGLHTYEAVKHDFESWLPKMSQRGVVLFHDTNVRHSDFAVWQLWAELEKQYPAFEFPFGFGLGVLAVGSDVPEPVLAFIEYAKSNVHEVVEFFYEQGQAAELRKKIAEVQRLQSRLNSIGEQLSHAMHVVEQRDEYIVELQAEQQRLNNDLDATQKEHSQQRQQLSNDLDVLMQSISHHEQLDEQQKNEIEQCRAYIDNREAEVERLNVAIDNQGYALVLQGYGIEQLDAQLKQQMAEIEYQSYNNELKQHTLAVQLLNAQMQFDRSLELLTERQSSLAQSEQQLRALDGQARLVLNSRIWRIRNALMSMLFCSKRRVNYSPASFALQRHEVSALAVATLPEKPIVTIVIPVYGGFEDTRCCIESVLASSYKTPAKIVVINDASPEPKLVEWLNDNARRFTLLHNEHNLGFVGTVNRGMALYPENDVVLVNSDTEVSNDWLDRLQGAAYSDALIGSVTPFSNNATICSYPIFCEDNELPEGYTPAELDQVFAEVNSGQMVDIPTAVGFCMFIRRDCLNDAGEFDAKLFGRGYGEENEFCMRSAQRGWRHVLTGDTFVYHKGGVSFADTQSEHQRHGHKVLARLYPHYDAVIQQHIAENPARSLRFAIDAAIAKRSGLPIVVVVNHCRGGGTDRHVLDFVEQLNGLAHVYLLTPEYENGPVYLRPFTQPQRAGLLFAPYSQFEQLLDTLRWIGVSRLHYHHTIGLPEPILKLPQELPCSYDITVHDYYLACPQVTLADEKGRYCGAPDEAGCNQCLTKRPAPQKQSIQEWRQYGGQFLKGAERVFVPSHDTLQRMQGYFPEANYIWAVHEPSLKCIAVKEPEYVINEPLRILVLGALSVFKGADTLEACALYAQAERVPLEFHLLGFAYRDLKTKPLSNLHVHGSYKDAELADLIAQIKPDVVWFPGSCPETYSYTLSAVIAAGLPVIASHIGAFSRRLADRKWTWLVQPDRSTAEIVEHFLEVKRMFAKGCSPEPLVIVDADVASFEYAADYTVTIEQPNYSLKQNLDLHSEWRMLPALQGDVAFAYVRSSFIRKLLPSILYSRLFGPLVASLPYQLKQNIKKRLRS